MTQPTDNMEVEQTAPTQDQVVEQSTPVETTTPVATDPAAPAQLDLSPQASETGNSTFDQVGKLLTEKGVAGVDAAFAEIAQTGEIPLAMQATLVEKLGDGVADLVIQSLQTEVTKIRTERQAQTNQTLDYASEKFGVGKDQGQAVWKDIQTFVRSAESGFTTADRATLTNMVQAGGLQAQLALDKIHAKFQAVQGFEQPADLLQGTTYAQASFEPISRAEYVSKMKELVAAHGEQSRQVAELRAHRTRSQQQGY